MFFLLNTTSITVNKSAPRPMSRRKMDRRYQRNLQFTNDENGNPGFVQNASKKSLTREQYITRSLRPVTMSVNGESVTRRSVPSSKSTQGLKVNPSRTPSVPQHRPISESTVAFIGDSKCGKTSLCLTYINKRFTVPKDLIMFETYENTVLLDSGELMKLQIWDFPGDDYFDRFRPLAYANAKTVAICFALTNVESLSSISERWIPEVETHCPGARRLIVGIGSEIRYDRTKAACVPQFEHLHNHAKSLGCHYIECTLANPDTCKSVFKKLALLSVDGMISEPEFLPKRPETRNHISHNKRGQSLSQKQLPGRRVTSYKKGRSIRCAIM